MDAIKNMSTWGRKEDYIRLALFEYHKKYLGCPTFAVLHFLRELRDEIHNQSYFSSVIPSPPLNIG